MTLEVGMIERYAAVFGNRMWWDETPDNLTPADRVAPFAILQVVGGTSREYVDQSEPEWINARVQVFVWGARTIAVGDAMRDLATVLRASNSPDWIAEPMGEAVGDSSDALKLRGLRRDFSITYRNPNFQG